MNVATFHPNWEKKQQLSQHQICCQNTRHQKFFSKHQILC